MATQHQSRCCHREFESVSPHFCCSLPQNRLIFVVDDGNGVDMAGLAHAWCLRVDREQNMVGQGLSSRGGCFWDLSLFLSLVFVVAGEELTEAQEKEVPPSFILLQKNEGLRPPF